MSPEKTIHVYESDTYLCNRCGIDLDSTEHILERCVSVQSAEIFYAKGDGHMLCSGLSRSSYLFKKREKMIYD